VESRRYEDEPRNFTRGRERDAQEKKDSGFDIRRGIHLQKTCDEKKRNSGKNEQ